jgi:AcrR family transcriptional regulator
VKRRGGSTAQLTGEETRQRIIAAATAAVNEHGITGASARVIARTGEFNQALIFYHFGSVDGLLIACAKAEGDARCRRYADRFGDVTTLAELVRAGREVHTQEREAGSINVLTQLIAGTTSSPTLRAGVHEAIRPWMALVDDALQRVLAGSSLLGFASTEDLAFAISSFFLGIELLGGLDPDRDRAGALLDTMERSAALLQVLVAATR